MRAAAGCTLCCAPPLWLDLHCARLRRSMAQESVLVLRFAQRLLNLRKNADSKLASRNTLASQALMISLTIGLKGCQLNRY